jgi:hypothetical protein
MAWYIHGCPICGGDLHDDLEEKERATCFLCARSFRTSEVKREARAPEAEFAMVGTETKTPRRRAGPARAA